MNDTIDNFNETEYKKIAVIGAGNIGTQVVDDLFEDDNQSEITVFNSSGSFRLHYKDIENYRTWSETEKISSSTSLSTWLKEIGTEYLDMTEWSEVKNNNDIKDVFITTPSNGSGLPYTTESLDTGKYVYTCEKYALANQFKDFNEAIKNGKLGITATVGGGTGIPLALMEDLEQNPLNPFNTFYGIVNGTTNFILTTCSGINPMQLDEAAEMAKFEGYTEPGAYDTISIIGEEIKDIAKKASIIRNLTLMYTDKTKYITENDIELKANHEQIAYDYLNNLYNDTTITPDIKLVVGIRNRNIPECENIINSESILATYENDNDDYILEIGFVERPPNELSKIRGVDNGATIFRNEKYHDLVLPGPGAGAVPTTTSMMNDYKRLHPDTDYHSILLSSHINI